MKHIQRCIPQSFVLALLLFVPFFRELKFESLIVIDLLPKKLLDLCIVMVSNVSSILFLLSSGRCGVLKNDVGTAATG